MKDINFLFSKTIENGDWHEYYSILSYKHTLIGHINVIHYDIPIYKYSMH
jgi:hypothetical protein